MTETQQQAIDFYNAGLAHMRAGRLAEARTCYERAITLRPDYARALHNLGTVLDDLGDHAAAEAQFRLAIAADGTAAEPWAGLGTCLRLAGRLSEARAAYEHALGLRSEFPAVRWNLALIDLAEGKFADGWTHYLFRPTLDRKQVPLAELPDDLSGTIVEIVDEQGLGDALFFLRFAPMIRARGGVIRYAPDPRLGGIVARMVNCGSAPANAKTIRVALGDLPFVLSATECPPSLPVAPLPERVERMRAILRGAGPAPYIGVTWRAGQKIDGYLYKDVPLDRLGNTLRKARGTLISVQRTPDIGEHGQLERAIGRPVGDLSAYNNDLEDMLALMSLLDEYVGVSNTNMHLRAGVGRPARVLVTNPAEYRWMAGGAASPWFPGVALYRQDADGSWGRALERLAGDFRP